MNRDAERRMADRALMTLQRGKYLHVRAALEEVLPVREEVGSGEGVERERAQAWLAISALCKMLAETPAHKDVPARWDNAIEKTTAWFESLT